MKNKEMEIVIKQKPLKKNHSLPKDVGDSLRSLSLLERKAYTILLNKNGWTFQSIAKELNLSREAVRLYAKEQLSEAIYQKVNHLPIPNIPTKEYEVSRVKRITIDPVVVKELKNLHSKAILVRGKSSKYRNEAEQFTKLAWQQKQNGVSTYAIAKALGITFCALHFRFVRYGLVDTKGKSRAFNKVQNRVKDNNA